MRYVSHFVRGLALATAAVSLTGCIVIPSGHRHFGPPRVAVEVHGRYEAPPHRYYDRRYDNRRSERRYEDDSAGPRRN